MTEKNIHVFKPLTVEDILKIEPLPKVHDVRVDLYWCSFGECENCSRKSEKVCEKTDIGGCRHDLLEDASEMLLHLEIMESNRR